MTLQPTNSESEHARELSSAAYITARYIGLPHNDAQDVAQEAFARLAASSDFQSREHAERVKIIRGIARNITIDRFRRSKVAPSPLDPSIQPVVSTDPDAAAALNDRITTLLHALRALSQSDQDVLVLRYVYGLSHREVGVVLGLEEDAARARAHRAEERLRRITGPL